MGTYIQDILNPYFVAGGNLRRTIAQGGVTVDGTAIRAVSATVDLDAVTRIKVGDQVVYDRCARDLEDLYKSDPVVSVALDAAAAVDRDYETTMRVVIKALAAQKQGLMNESIRRRVVPLSPIFKSAKQPSRDDIYQVAHTAVWNFVDDEDLDVSHDQEERLAEKIAFDVEGLWESE